MDRQKVIGDTILAAQEPDDFMDACQQLKDANLWQWANQAGGHGIEALSQAVGLTGNEVNERYRW